MRTDELRIEATEARHAHGASGAAAEGAGRQSPGADRFWGEFSRTRAGRSNPGGSGNGSGRERREPTAECLDWCPICRSADLIRSTAPVDLVAQLETIQGEALNVMRAFVAAYAEKAGDPRDGRSGSRSADQHPGEEGPVDIPVD